MTEREALEVALTVRIRAVDDAWATYYETLKPARKAQATAHVEADRAYGEAEAKARIPRDRDDYAAWRVYENALTLAKEDQT